MRSLIKRILVLSCAAATATAIFCLAACSGDANKAEPETPAMTHDPVTLEVDGRPGTYHWHNFVDGKCTLCDETMFAVMEKHGDVYSNIQPDPEFRLQDINRSIKHTFLDFGDDDFTNGKPHPMIDPTNRISRLIEEARDPEVAVIVMDFVLGFGSHEDPVGSTIEAIKEAKAIAAAEGRELIILAYVLGTDLDTPSLEQQSQMLLDAGVILASSSTNTGLLAREFICKGEEA